MRENGDGSPPANATDVARALGLAPHPEGGFFRETYRSPLGLDTGRGHRSLATAVTFLVTAGSPSRFHRLASDELWIHQSGEPLELLLIDPGGALLRIILGDLLCAARDLGVSAPVATACVPAGTWQAARLAAGRPGTGDRERSWTLVTCFVSPGFDYADFELGERDGMLAAYPEHRAEIVALT
jgi:uncharacterized protein